MDKPPQRSAPRVSPAAPQRPRPGGAPGASRPGVKPGGGGAPMRKSGSPEGNQAFSGQKPPWYKRKYLVYPQFQMTLILINSGVTIVLFGMTALLVVRSHIYLEALVKETRLPAQNLFTQLITQQLRTLLTYMMVALLVSVFTTGITTLLLSHKMAGPMIKLRNFFNGISKDGDFPEELYFRKGDFFQDLPPLINKAFTALKKKWIR